MNYKNIDKLTLDNLLEGFQLIDFKWRYLYLNNAAVKQSEYGSRDELIGYTMMEKYPGIEGTEMFRTLQKCMDERISGNMESEFAFPNGSQGWFELRVHPVSEGISILSIDITHRKRHELAIESRKKELEEMMYITSHRIRQPITNILGISYMLDDAKLSKDDFKQTIKYMKESINSLDTLTEELTHFIRARQNNDETG